jgi:hypothetical protein
MCGVEVAGNYTAHMRMKVKAFFSGRVISHQLNVQMMDQAATLLECKDIRYILHRSSGTYENP